MKKIRLTISNFRNWHVLTADILLSMAAVLGSYALRSELNSIFFFYLPSALWMMGAAVIIKPLVYYFFGLYRRIWTYVSTNDLKLLVAAVTTASVLVSAVMVILTTLRVFVGFPRAVVVIDWVLSILAVGGLRFVVRLLAETHTQPVSSSQRSMTIPLRKVLIIGAGDGGALVVRELQKNPQIGLSPVGFLDDSAAKQRQQIYGVPVIGKLDDLANVLDQQKVHQVIMAIPSAPGRVMRKVSAPCQASMNCWAVR
jgi:FlaA1/EpsC-like NDP-sugar epimerase